MGRFIFNRQFELTLLAVAMLTATIIVRFSVDEAHGIMLLGVIPITLIGIMHGVKAGLLAAVVASISFEIWAIGSDASRTLEMIDVPLTFFILGGLSGGYARGAMGDFDLQRSARRSELRAGIRKGELRMHYQPMIDAGTGRVTGLEALVRWEHPRRGMVPPIDFVPLAAGDGQTIEVLTAEVIERTTEELGPLLSGSGAGLRVGINLAAKNLGQPRIFKLLESSCAKHGIPLEKVQIEVTEDDLISNRATAAAALEAIREHGVGVALDDFGTGYSSLAELTELPISALKIDRNLREEAAGELSGMVAPLVSLAHQIGLVVVAEQVETKHVFNQLVQLGVDEIQGFVVGRPMPRSELDEWLETYRERVSGAD